MSSILGLFSNFYMNENIQEYWDRQTQLLEKLYGGVGDYVKTIKEF